MRKHFILLAALVILAVGILYALNLNSGAANRVKNGFTRKYAAKQPVLLKEKNFKTAFYALAGTKGDTLFLTGMRPDLIFVTTTSLDKLDTIQLNLPEIKNLVPAFYTTVLFPDYYIIGSNARMLIKGDLITRSVDTVKINVGGIVSKPIVVNNNRFISRVIEDKTHSALFKLFDSTGRELNANPVIEAQLADAGFNNDGSLSFDNNSGRFAYVTYYLNKVALFDTNLNLLNHSQTLDTNRTTKFELKKGKNSITHKSPPLMINTFCTQHNGNLYVKSKLEADNEEREFESASTIDRFDKDGKYIESLYLPDGKTGRIRNFYFLNNNYLLGINLNHIMLYKTE